MARGWESKDVESQIEEREQTRQASGPERTPEEIERLRQIEVLTLTRTRVAADLARATNPRHRAQIEESLRFLDRQLAALR